MDNVVSQTLFSSRTLDIGEGIIRKCQDWSMDNIQIKPPKERRMGRTKQSLVATWKIIKRYNTWSWSPPRTEEVRNTYLNSS
jgi:hypothetical protein